MKSEVRSDHVRSPSKASSFLNCNLRSKFPDHSNDLSGFGLLDRLSTQTLTIAGSLSRSISS